MTIRKFAVILLFPSFIVFSLRGVLLLDPDFGWHYKMGEIIRTSGIPKTDPFSYTMPSFPFVDHEWLTNTGIYFVYSWVGYHGLAFLYALFALLALKITLRNPLSRNIKLPFDAKYIVLFLFGMGTLVPYVGIRPQLESWLMMSVLLYIILNKNMWIKFRFGVPSLFFLWTNMHGSFGLGLALLLLVLFLKAVRIRKIDWIDIVVGVLSILVTFVNPYGYNIWNEFWLQVSDANLRWTVGEWRPTLFDFNIWFITIAALSSMLVWKYHKRYVLEEKVLFVILLIAALVTSRQVPLWVMVALPITAVGFSFFYDDANGVPLAHDRLSKMLRYSCGVLAVFVGISCFLSLRHAAKFGENIYYPKDAVTYLKEHDIQGNVFADYDYGGYLIWHYPEKKVFIDGRMPSWRWNKNPSNEEAYSFDTYTKLLEDEISYKEVFEKYYIQTVVIPKEKIENADSFFKTGKDIKNGKEQTSFIERIEKDEWIKVYEDEVSQIYQNPNMLQYSYNAGSGGGSKRQN